MTALSASHDDLGDQLYALVADLYPLFRSITGPGVRATLKRLQQHIPIEVHEVPTGTKVLDWEVPREWQIRRAYIEDADGRMVVDTDRSNLHVMSYSVPVRTTMTWAELEPHVFSLPEHPDWTPFRTSYYDERWGFCMPHAQVVELQRDPTAQYCVNIDASLEDGSLTLGEMYIPGAIGDEVLISTHICHPSLANDNCSGLAVATFLADYVRRAPRHYSYRFIFVPATIGALTWLAMHRAELHRIRHGLVLSLLGDAGSLTYKKSRRGDADIDRVVNYVLGHSGEPFTVLEFSPIGYDERQFCSPGFDLPVGCLMRTPNGAYPEYHTSADDLTLVRPDSLADSLRKCRSIIAVLEGNRAYVNLKPHGEPRLGPLGLYEAYGQVEDRRRLQDAVLWVLNLSDGEHTLLDICERADLPFAIVREAASKLHSRGLLRELLGEAVGARLTACHPEAPVEATPSLP